MQRFGLEYESDIKLVRGSSVLIVSRITPSVILEFRINYKTTNLYKRLAGKWPIE
jgi:hypothetical protein